MTKITFNQSQTTNMNAIKSLNQEQQDIVAKMRTLITEVRKHNNAYYVMDEPTISDNEYDQLRLSLIELEERYPDLTQSDSPTASVGDNPLPSFILSR